MDHRYMRPPLSSPLPPPPPGPPPGPPPQHQQQQDSSSWYSTTSTTGQQFQYPSHHSPSPPPPPPPQHTHQQWAPPPPPYPAHPGPPYPPPPPPPHSYQQPLRPPHPYPSQDWGHASWNHHPGWEYPAQSNEEDWAARARAWASARSAMENQNPQSQFSTGARPEDSSQYSNHYSQPFESHYQDTQQTAIPTASFPNYPAPVATLNRPPMGHPPDPASISSYSSDGHFAFAAKDGALGGDASSGFAHHQVTANSSVYQQEVPSSYSSIPGREDGSGMQRHGHSLLPADPRALPVEQTQFVYGNHMDPMDQPLEFASRFGHGNDQTMKSSYPDSAGPLRGLENSATASLNAWTAPVGPNVSYPSVTPAFQSAPQHDPSLGVPPLPGQPASMFPRGPGFQSTVPSMLPPVGLSAAAVHPSSAFPMDAYGAALNSERPKKAAVPNWLREEIIKKKPAITSSIPDHFKDGSQSTEDDSIDKSVVKGDQADSKSLDSSRSTEEEEDDEDYEEAQKTAAINQEIKRIVTEVLLKVTDEFFDEIATKVLGEDDHVMDGTAEPNNHVPNHKAPPPPPPVPAAKASAKVLVPVRESESGPSGDSSQSPGNVLGLANYTSDDDDGDNQTSKEAKSDVGSGRGAGENGHSQPEAEEHNSTLVYAEGDHDMSTTSSDKKGDRADDGKLLIRSDISKLSENSKTTSLGKLEDPVDRRNSRKPIEEDSHERDARRYDRHDSKRSSHGRDTLKETDSRKSGEDEEKHGRKEEKHQKKEKTGDHMSSKERSNEQVRKTKDKLSDSKKRSPDRHEKDSKKERERNKKANEVDRADRKRERSKDEKGDKSRHKSSRDGDKHKRRRSSSVDSRNKRSKASPGASDNSSDKASPDSRRRGRSKKRDSSPSPVKSRRRQVSRSPHSKHTQRRQSPYSSLDGSRGKKSRSRSPVHRRR